MSNKKESCHGQFDCLLASSKWRLTNRVSKAYQKVASYVVWHIENGRMRNMLSHTITAVREPFAGPKAGKQAMRSSGHLSQDREVLGLRPGELVEVKSVEEIMATLDSDRKCGGLLWMTGMRKFCGRRYRVFKKVEKILLESNGELRTMKNTVTLEGVMCDGEDFRGCDRSCFHFWREVWLGRVGE